MTKAKDSLPKATVSGEWKTCPRNLRFVEKVGQGGIAKVYKAIQEPLGRTVGVKLLAYNTSEQVERFKREAKLMSQLQHENITHIHDFYIDNGKHFMVMEFVEGIDLAELLDEPLPFPPEIAAIITLEIARSLEYIHTRKIIHRDIKPGNIMISFDGNIKIMDFGIAIHLDDMEKELEKDMGIGTPAYISPEQLRGDPVDGRTDIYSLGVVLYRMLTGVKPFVYKSENTLFSKIQNNTPIPPQSLLPTIPRVLNQIIMKCLEKSPEKRYADAAELERDLEHYLRKTNPLLKFEIQLIEFLQARGKIEFVQTDTIKSKLAVTIPRSNQSYSFSFSFWAVISFFLALLLILQTVLLVFNFL